MLRPYVFLLGEQLPQPFFHLGIRHRRRACLARRAQQLRMDVRAVGEHWNPARSQAASSRDTSAPAAATTAPSFERNSRSRVSSKTRLAMGMRGTP